MTEISRHGAMPEDWDALVQGSLTVDLLPVVCNPDADISARSKIKKIGKVPSVYNHQGQVIGMLKWTDYEANLNDIKEWREEPDYGICIQSRVLRAIDIDIEDESGAIRNKIIDWFEINAGTRPPIRSRNNSHRCLIVFAVSGENIHLDKHIIKSDQGNIEILGNGQQFVAFGQHISGSRYEWDVYPTPVNVPFISENEFQGLLSLLSTHFHGSVEVIKANTTSVGEYVPNDGLIDSSKIFKALSDKGMVHGESDDGYVITCPFNEEHTTGVPGDGSTEYRPQAHIKDLGIDQSEVIICLHSHCRSRPLISYEEKLGLHGNPTDGFEMVTEEPDSTPVKECNFEFVPDNTFGILSNENRTDWLVDDVIPTKALVMIYGPPASGKSFVVLDMAYDISQGNKAFAKRHATQHKVPVLYVAGEGVAGMRKRVNGIRNHRGIGIGEDSEELLYFCESRGLDLRDADTVKAFILAVKDMAVKPRLIVFDTLSACAPGIDENKGADGTVVQEHCKQIISKCGATVVLVHHSGKDAEKGARGWSGYKGMVDTEITVCLHSNGARTFEVTKQKDGDSSKLVPYAYALKEIPVDLTRWKAKIDKSNPKGFAILNLDGSPVLEEVPETTNIVDWGTDLLPPPKGEKETASKRDENLANRITEYLSRKGEVGEFPNILEEKFITEHGSRVYNKVIKDLKNPLTGKIVTFKDNIGNDKLKLKSLELAQDDAASGFEDLSDYDSS